MKFYCSCCKLPSRIGPWKWNLRILESFWKVLEFHYHKIAGTLVCVFCVCVCVCGCVCVRACVFVYSGSTKAAVWCQQLSCWPACLQAAFWCRSRWVTGHLLWWQLVSLSDCLSVCLSVIVSHFVSPLVAVLMISLYACEISVHVLIGTAVIQKLNSGFPQVLESPWYFNQRDSNKERLKTVLQVLIDKHMTLFRNKRSILTKLLLLRLCIFGLYGTIQILFHYY